MEEKRRKIVVSAINLFSGGTLTILQQCIKALEENYIQDYLIIILVHDRSLLEINSKEIEIIEFKKSRKSWVFRLYYEYIYFRGLSKKIAPYLWLSLHDISPSVTAERKAVYCHNPSPFYNLPLEEAKQDLKFTLFNKFYSYLYKINIRQNSFVIVQQEWLRSAFKKRFSISNIIVAHPEGKMAEESYPEESGKQCVKKITTFFYPALPRIFKNFEIIGEAVRRLSEKGIGGFQVLFTIEGNENKYAEGVFTSYGKLEEIKFIGLQSKKDVSVLYQKSDCVIFPSKLETWGLPISEAKYFKKPILLIDLPYARETVGDYDLVKFFEPENGEQLALFMESVIKNKMSYEVTERKIPIQPFASSWQGLFKIMLS